MRSLTPSSVALCLFVTFAIIGFPGPAHAAGIVIVGEHQNMAAAIRIRAAFKQVPPFSYMIQQGTLKIHVLEVRGLHGNCARDVQNPYDNGLLWVCNASAKALANKAKADNDSNFAIIVDGQGWGGSGGEIPVVTSGLVANGALHELLHTMGFSDEDGHGNTCAKNSVTFQLASRGAESGCGQHTSMPSIMYRLDSNYIPQSYWPHIAQSLGVPAPAGSADSSFNRSTWSPVNQQAPSLDRQPVRTYPVPAPQRSSI